jgi:hypothetical protein
MKADPVQQEPENNRKPQLPLWLIVVYLVLILWCLWSVLQYWD